AAARRADAVRNRVFTDPLLHGRYPADLIEDLAPVTDFGFVRDGDLALAAAPLDLLGVNFYQPHRVAASPEGIDPSLLESGGDTAAVVGCETEDKDRHGLERTGMVWEIDPSGL